MFCTTLIWRLVTEDIRYIQVFSSSARCSVTSDMYEVITIRGNSSLWLKSWLPVHWHHHCVLQRCWTQWSFWVPTNSEYSMIPWFYVVCLFQQLYHLLDQLALLEEVDSLSDTQVPKSTQKLSSSVQVQTTCSELCERGTSWSISCLIVLLEQSGPWGARELVSGFWDAGILYHVDSKLVSRGKKMIVNRIPIEWLVLMAL